MLHVRGRDAVGFAEAGLIGMLHACGDYDDRLNINHRNNDKGGSGPRHDCELDDWFYVYLATNIGEGCEPGSLTSSIVARVYRSHHCL